MSTTRNTHKNDVIKEQKYINIYIYVIHILNIQKE